jgi:hypothetical protein
MRPAAKSSVGVRPRRLSPLGPPRHRAGGGERAPAGAGGLRCGGEVLDRIQRLY